MNVNTGDNIELSIEKLVYGMNGLARFNDLVIFVPYSLPNEKVKVEITSKKKDYAEARILDILEPSEARVNAPCPIYGICGGCHYQHISYQKQLDLKKEILIENLNRISGKSDINIPGVMGSEKEFYYRNRTRLKTEETGEGYKIGFYKKNMHELVEVSKCMLLHPILNEALSNISAILKDKKYMKLMITEIDLHYSSFSGEILLSIDVKRYNAHTIQELIESLHSLPLVISGVIIYTIKKKMVYGSDFNMEDLNVIKYRISERSFSQVNWSQNSIMVRKVMDFADLKGNEKVLELYSGIGNFSLHLARKAKILIGIEGNRHSNKDAVYNAENNNIINCNFINEEVEKGVERLLADNSYNSPDLLLLNPPREGVRRNILSLTKQLSPNKIIYVSCNPSTLSRDVNILKEEGFRLNRIQPIDIFPQTYHIETIAELVK